MQRKIIRVLAGGFLVLPICSGTDLTPLTQGTTVKLVMIAEGPLCEAKVERMLSPVVMTLNNTSVECGKKGGVPQISKDKILDVTPQGGNTKRRVAIRLLIGAAGVAALAAVALTSSESGNTLPAANYAIPGPVFYAVWKAVPARKEHLLFFACPDRFHCFVR